MKPRRVVKLIEKSIFGMVQSQPKKWSKEVVRWVIPVITVVDLVTEPNLANVVKAVLEVASLTRDRRDSPAASSSQQKTNRTRSK
jgi:hypothetical protein